MTVTAPTRHIVILDNPVADPQVLRDAKSVQGDVQALLGCGILSKTTDGLAVFPFEKVHVDFMLEAA